LREAAERPQLLALEPQVRSDTDADRRHRYGHHRLDDLEVGVGQGRERDPRFEPVLELLDAKRAGVREPRQYRKAGQHDEGGGDGGGRLGRLAVTAVLAEERQVDATSHVGGGEERADETDVQEKVEARLTGGDEDLVLRPEAGKRKDAGERERADDE